MKLLVSGYESGNFLCHGGDRGDSHGQLSGDFLAQPTADAQRSVVDIVAVLAVTDFAIANVGGFQIVVHGRSSVTGQNRPIRRAVQD